MGTVDWLAQIGVTESLAEDIVAAGLSPAEQAELLRIVESWGEEDSVPGETASEARADLAERVRRYLRAQPREGG